MLFFCHVTKLIMSSGSFQWTSKRKLCFHAVGLCFWLFLDIALQKPETCLRAVYKLLITGNRIEKLLLVRFLLLFCLGRYSKNTDSFRPHCIISAYAQGYELKFNVQANFNAFILNLKLYFQYSIVMTSWWHNIWKIVLCQLKLHIFRLSATNNLFLYILQI